MCPCLSRLTAAQNQVVKHILSRNSNLYQRQGIGKHLSSFLQIENQPVWAYTDVNLRLIFHRIDHEVLMLRVPRRLEVAMTALPRAPLSSLLIPSLPPRRIHRNLERDVEVHEKTPVTHTTSPVLCSASLSTRCSSMEYIPWASRIWMSILHVLLYRLSCRFLRLPWSQPASTSAPPLQETLLAPGMSPAQTALASSFTP